MGKYTFYPHFMSVLDSLLGFMSPYRAQKITLSSTHATFRTEIQLHAIGLGSIRIDRQILQQC